jgi:hypothetical protein
LQLQSSNLEVDTFQHHASDLIAPDLLSLTWTSRLLDSSLCLEQVSGVQRMASEATSEDDDVLLLGEKWCRILFFFFFP